MSDDYDYWQENQRYEDELRRQEEREQEQYYRDLDRQEREREEYESYQNRLFYDEEQTRYQNVSGGFFGGWGSGSSRDYDDSPSYSSGSSYSGSSYGGSYGGSSHYHIRSSNGDAFKEVLGFYVYVVICLGLLIPSFWVCSLIGMVLGLGTAFASRSDTGHGLGAVLAFLLSLVARVILFGAGVLNALMLLSLIF